MLKPVPEKEEDELDGKTMVHGGPMDRTWLCGATNFSSCTTVVLAPPGPGTRLIWPRKKEGLR